MDNDKVILDSRSFRALSSESRVQIMKLLEEKRLTVTELSNLLKQNKSSVLEHLEKLVEADIVRKKEDTHKWVYYELTWRGKKILHPEITKIVIALSLTFILIAGIVLTGIVLVLRHNPSSQVTVGIKIDGKFDDWTGTQKYSQTHSSVNPNIEIINYTVNCSQYRVSFYLEVAGKMLAGQPNGTEMDCVHIFIDSDMNPATGYRIKGIGADYMINITGRGGKINSSELQTYDTSRDSKGFDWNAWVNLREVLAEVSGGKLETQVYSNYIGLNVNQSSVNVLFHTTDFLGNEDFSDAIINTKHPSLLVTQKSVDIHDTILYPAPNGTTEILDLGLRAFNSNLIIQKLTLNIDTTVPLARLGPFIAKSDDGKTFTGLATGNTVTLAGNLSMGKNESQTFKVYADFQFIWPEDRAKVFGLMLTSVETKENAVLTLNSDLANIRKYISESPKTSILDGAFGDWKSTRADSVGDANNSNIDITNYDAKVQASDFMFYLRVDGTFMGGKTVPVNPRTIQELPSVRESDRDTLNDTVDPYPFDFNNDGIPDSQTNHDIDGDGLIDYPYGLDRWLNTTIPGTAMFPAEYRNRFVSVYIGPTMPVRQPIVTGEDTAYIFINSDNNTTTGSNSSLVNAPQGTDFIIVINGKENTITSSKLFKYSNNNWTYINNVDVKYDGVQAEFGVSTAEIVLTGNYTVQFKTMDWKGFYDLSQLIVG